jgi:hypothetical protein
MQAKMQIPDFVRQLSSYKKEIILLLVGAVVTLLFQKILPAMGVAVRQVWSLLYAVLRGHGREYVFLRKYCDWLINANRHPASIPTLAINPERVPTQPELESIFIRMRLSDSDYAGGELPISQLVRRGARTVILGDPGAGKTTLLRYLCVTYARLHRTRLTAFRKRQELKERFRSSDSRIPILVQLNQLYRQPGASSLADLMRVTLPVALRSRCPETFFDKLLESGRAVVLLDGLDELASQEFRLQAAQEIGSCAGAVNKETIWIVTSRIVGYEPTLQQHHFRVATVEDLEPEQIEAFVTTWYQAKCEASGFAKDELEYQRVLHSDKAGQLVETIRSNAGLASLAKSPMLVSLIALLHFARVQLPDNRALLYRDCLELLIERWDLSKGLKAVGADPTATTDQKLGLLTEVAWRMHLEQRKEIKRLEVEAIIEEWGEKKGVGSGQHLARMMLGALEERTGIVISRGFLPTGDKLLSFSHLSFQEYLVSRKLRNDGETAAREFILSHVTSAWWREPILLYVAQSESPVQLIGEFYSLAKDSLSPWLLLTTAACLAEVQLRATDDLHAEILGDLLTMWLGEIVGPLQRDRIVLDHQRLIIRYLVANFNEALETQINAYAAVLALRWEAPEAPEKVAEFAKQIQGQQEVSGGQKAALRYLTVTNNIHRSEALRYVLCCPEAIFPSPIPPYRVSESQFVAAAVAPFTSRILQQCLDGDFELQQADLGGERPDWIRSVLIRILHRTSPRFVLAHTQHSGDRAFFLEYLKAGKYQEAQKWIRDADENELSDVRLTKYRPRNRDEKALMAMAFLARHRLADDAIDFVVSFIGEQLTEDDRPPSSGRSASSPSHPLVMRGLFRRSLDALRLATIANPALIRLAFSLLSTNNPDAHACAAATLARAAVLPYDLVSECLGHLNSSDRRVVWGAITALGLGHNDYDAGQVIGALLNKLSDRKEAFPGTTIRQTAALALTRLLTRRFPTSASSQS